MTEEKDEPAQLTPAKLPTMVEAQPKDTSVAIESCTVIELSCGSITSIDRHAGITTACDTNADVFEVHDDWSIGNVRAACFQMCSTCTKKIDWHYRSIVHADLRVAFVKCECG